MDLKNRTQQLDGNSTQQLDRNSPGNQELVMEREKGVVATSEVLVVDIEEEGRGEISLRYYTVLYVIVHTAVV